SRSAISSSQSQRKMASRTATTRISIHEFSCHFARPCSVSTFRVNFYVSIAVKILTLADCFKLKRKRNRDEDSRVSSEGDSFSLWGYDSPRRSCLHQGRSARGRPPPAISRRC